MSTPAIREYEPEEDLGGEDLHVVAAHELKVAALSATKWANLAR